MTIRTLPAVGDPEAARTLTGLLEQLPDVEPLPRAGESVRLLDTLAGLAAASLDELPEVVLVHESIGPAPALELIREVALRFPAVGVVLLTADAGPALYSAAMDSGARGLAGWPATYDELGSRVRAAAQWATGVRRHLGGGDTGPAGPGGRLLAVTGAKGGVGTTVTAVQLALAARAAGREVVLVDMDLQSGDVASYLDVQFRRSIADLAQIGDLTPRVLQEAVFAHQSGLGLLLAPGDGERGEEVTDAAARRILTALRAHYELVIADCGTQITAAGAATIEAADTALLVTTPDVVAVRAAKRMVRLWDRLQIRTAEQTLTVVNRHTRAAEIQPRLVERATGTRAARTCVPAAYKELQPAVDSGRMQDLDAKSAVRQALWALAGELGLVAAPATGGRTAHRGDRAAPVERALTGLRRRRALAAGTAEPDAAAATGAPGLPAGDDTPAAPGTPPPAGPGTGSGTDAGTGPDALTRVPTGRFGRRRGDRGDRGERGPRGDRGQVTVEFLGVIPLILVVLIVIWQCVLAGYTYSLAGNAADQGARAGAAAETGGAAACARAAREDLPSAWRESASTECREEGGLFKATVRVKVPVLFPGAADFPWTVSGTAGAVKEG
ncbi:septum formation initiator [Streptomyces albus subsp. albus]|nr:septum formation initiator [Streptomyces albus subsp. albus]